MLLLCTLQQFEYDTNLLVREFFPGEEIERRNDNSDACLFMRKIREGEDCSFYAPSAGDGTDSGADYAVMNGEDSGKDRLLLCAEYTDKTTTVVRYKNGQTVVVEFPIESLWDDSGDATKETAGIMEEEDIPDVEEKPRSSSGNEDGIGNEDKDGIEKDNKSELEKEKKKKFKQAHMHNLYLALRKLTGKDLPWGSLTGVRPTKLARQMILKGSTEEEIRSFYEQDRFVSKEKSTLAIEIAKRETEIISSVHPYSGYSLYIGIPFCPTRCAYCSFLSGAIGPWQKRIPEYLSCIEKELDFVRERFANRPLDTVYIGGGTPTALSADELFILTEMIAKYLPLGQLREYTVEAGRPDSITPEKLKVLKEASVTRISVNPQSMNDETLLRIGRRHTVSQIYEAYDLSRKAGFDNINMDMIIGLPGEGVKEVEKTVREIVRLAPDSLTVHSLAVKRSSKLREEDLSLKNALHTDAGNASGNSGIINPGYSENERSAKNDIVKMSETAYEGAKELHLNPYYLYRQKNIAGNLENVGFAKDGKYGIYNILMMEGVQSIVALGAGTVSKKVLSEKEISRCDTAKDIGLYMDGIDDMIKRKAELFAQM